jgi:hypothetical protein
MSVATALVAVVVAVAPFQIGRSVQARPIVALRVGNPHGTPVLVVGCVHVNECAGIAIIHALERVHTRADLWLVPDLNPDGVDLNANWSSDRHGGRKVVGVLLRRAASVLGTRDQDRPEPDRARPPDDHDLVSPAHEPDLGVGAEHDCRLALRSRIEDAGLPPPVACGHSRELAKPPLPSCRIVHGRAPGRIADAGPGRRPGARGADTRALTYSAPRTLVASSRERERGAKGVGAVRARGLVAARLLPTGSVRCTRGRCRSCARARRVARLSAEAQCLCRCNCPRARSSRRG